MIYQNMFSLENWREKYQFRNEHPLMTEVRAARTLAETKRDKYEADLDVDKETEKYLKTLVKFELDPCEDIYDMVKYPLTYVHEGYDFNEELLYEDSNGVVLRPVGLKNTTGGRITANIGTTYKGASLLNCFIAPPVRSARIEYDIKLLNGQSINCRIDTEDTSDSLPNIMLTALEQAETLKSEGGWGINYGFIRPRSSIVRSVGVKHPGVIAFMEIFDKVSEVIVKGGDGDGYKDSLQNYLNKQIVDAVPVDVKKQARKGAMMAVLPVWHPDIEEYIRAKQGTGKLTKFNMSVLIDDFFMEAVVNDDLYDLHFKGVVYKTVKARELYDLIMKSNYDWAEPGVLFFDAMNKYNPLVYIMPASATNPCGEIAGMSFIDIKHNFRPELQKWVDNWETTELNGVSTVCLLGSVNLTMYVNQDRSFDYDEYSKDLEVFTEMLDLVNDIGNVPLPHYQWAIDNLRQIGIGINGQGSALLMMGLGYNTKEGLDVVERWAKLKQRGFLLSSIKLAYKYGSFPAMTDDYFETEFFHSLDGDIQELIRMYGIRNGKGTTNPPLGNSSVKCNHVSNGPEPVFMFVYGRTYVLSRWPEGLHADNVKDFSKGRKQGGQDVWDVTFEGVAYFYEPHNRGICGFTDVVDYGYKWVTENYPEDILALMAPESNPDIDTSYFVTTRDLSVQDHINAQAIHQHNVDQSISKTINIPADYDFEDFKNVYIDGWKAGLVGLTTYRDGTIGSVLSASVDKADTKLALLREVNAIKEGSNITEHGVIISNVKLPTDFINGDTKIVKREGNKYYIFMSYLPNDEEKLFPIAIWVMVNGFDTSKEYVSMRRAIKAIHNLMFDSGIASHLITRHTKRVEDDIWTTKLAKTISMALRHNIEITEIIAHLDNIEGDHIATTLTAIRKFLKKAVKNGTVMKKVCPSCGSSNMVYESGCDRCLDCDHSGCS